MLSTRFRGALGMGLLLSLAAIPARPLSDQEVLEYANRTVSWYRDTTALTRTPTGAREALAADSLRQSAARVLKLSFDFARAQAAVAGNGSSSNSALLASQGAAAQSVERLQDQIEEIDRQLGRAPARSRKLLEAKRDTLAAALNLAKARKDALHNLAGALSSSDNGGLAAKIDELERTVPEADSKTLSPAPAQDFHPEAAGIMGLVSAAFEHSRAIHRLGLAAAQTDELRREHDRLRQPLRDALRAVTRRGEELARVQDDVDAASLAAGRKELDTLLGRFRQLSAELAPLAQQAAPLNASQAALLEWRAALGEEYSAALRYLILRLAVLAAAIAVIFVFSEMWRRGTLRYVQDARRRRQLLLLRRIVVGCTITVFVVLSFVTEFGSLATFAGFSAAGIALALQSVLVSVVAYFFLVGRWGVRVGDRVTVSGVTGEVLDIGLFRLYLMELGGSGLDLRPTGRIVVFPNAVFFQPSALFKQFPGIDYGWRRVALTVTPDNDYDAVEKRLMGVVEGVWGEYRERLERQHKAAQSSLDLPTEPPRPESSVCLVEGGLQFAVRYPVELRRAGEIDDQVSRQLLAAVHQEPQVRLAPGGAPVIKAA